jgi:predicted DNA-binding transcriptional regulator AlpA
MTITKDDASDQRPERLYKEPQVCDFTGWSRSKLRAEIAKGNFDPPIKTGLRGSAWFESSITRHQAKLKTQHQK